MSRAKSTTETSASDSALGSAPDSKPRFPLQRRQVLGAFLIGSAVSGGLAIAWHLWPRTYLPNIATSDSQIDFNAFLKIDSKGLIHIIVPQCEMGQGVTTLLPQIIADELGADWRTIAVETAPLNPLYRNTLLAADSTFLPPPSPLDNILDIAKPQRTIDQAMMITAASSSVRNFELPCRIAAAQARTLLAKAAALQWNVPWQACDTKDGFVTHADKSIRFAEVAATAATLRPPAPLPLRSAPPPEINASPQATETPEGGQRPYGANLVRLDSPAKSDGAFTFAADVRLEGMVYAAIRQGPIGETRLKSIDREAGMQSPDLLSVVERDDWFATIASNWWAANQALDRFAPTFETASPPMSTQTIWRSLAEAIDSERGEIISERGDVASLRGAYSTLVADYGVAPALHAPIETRSATAHVDGAWLHLWVATQAPALCHRAVAEATGWDADKLFLYPMHAGGSFGIALDHRPAVQAAILAQEVKKPVQLCWSRAEDIMHDLPRAPVHARLSGYYNRNGSLVGLETRLATPAASYELHERLRHNAPPEDARQGALGKVDIAVGSGAQGAEEAPAYNIPHVAVTHCPADIGLPVGRWRGNADSYTAFFTESFIDEMAEKAGSDGLSYRVRLLRNAPRLARCMVNATSLGGWEGGAVGSAQGLACHSMRGSHIALLATARIGQNGLRVEKLAAVVDCGRIVNPAIVRQQIEGGLIFGLAAAVGATSDYQDNLATARKLRQVGLPLLRHCPDIVVEIIASDNPPGGVGELAVPVVAPAIANALYTVTGRRIRSLPLSESLP